KPSERAFWRTAPRVMRANALFQLGLRGECEKECEAVRREIDQVGLAEDAGDEVDHAFFAFRWCDLQLGLIVSPCSPLSGQAGPESVDRVWEEIDARANQLLRVAARFNNTPLAEAVGDLLRGRGRVVRGVYGGAEADLKEGEALLDLALRNLKDRAQEFYASGLRACIALYLHGRRLKEAEA